MSKRIAKLATIPVGTNLNLSMDGDAWILSIDLTQDHGVSAAGKSRKVATSGGNVSVAAGLKLGVNVYDPIVGRKLTVKDIPDQGTFSIGSNILARIERGVLFLSIDAGQDLGPTKSEKSRLVASTGGNTTIAAGLKLGVNLYDPIPTPRA